VNVKRCPRCEQVKPMEAFYLSQGRRSSHCKQCNGERKYGKGLFGKLSQRGPEAYLKTGVYGLPKEYITWIKKRISSDDASLGSVA
jgi:hypothetical protein